MTRIYRIEWLPGSDRLRGTCHCGATIEGQDPLSMWQWLLAHPAHPGPGDPGPATS